MIISEALCLLIRTAWARLTGLSSLNGITNHYALLKSRHNLGYLVRLIAHAAVTQLHGERPFESKPPG
eukprot:11764463-Karenia_brevis.AAC.1